MAMNTRRELRTLERVVIPPDDRCGVCGYAPGAEIKFVVSFDDEPIDGPDVCRGAVGR